MLPEILRRAQGREFSVSHPHPTIDTIKEILIHPAGAGTNLHGGPAGRDARKLVLERRPNAG